MTTQPDQDPRHSTPLPPRAPGDTKHLQDDQGAVGTDLSMDDKDKDGSSEKFNAQGSLYTQRHNQRKWLFWLALAASGAMGVFFILFVRSVLCWTWRYPDKSFDWHILMLGSALIVPPTLVVWNLMKQVFRSDGKLENGQKNDGGTGLLWSDVVKEALDVTKEYLSSRNKS